MILEIFKIRTKTSGTSVKICDFAVFLAGESYEFEQEQEQKHSSDDVPVSVRGLASCLIYVHNASYKAVYEENY